MEQREGTYSACIIRPVMDMAERLWGGSNVNLSRSNTMTSVRAESSLIMFFAEHM